MFGQLSPAAEYPPLNNADSCGGLWGPTVDDEEGEKEEAEGQNEYESA